MGQTEDLFDVRVIESASAGGTSFEVLEYGPLSGGRKWRAADRIYSLNKTGIRLHQVRILLNESEVVIESGALHFMSGSIEARTEVGGVGGFAKKMAAKMATSESMFRPTYAGSGEMYLEPTFGHFGIMRLDDEMVVADKGMFYCCEAGLEIGVYRNKGMAKHYGGEGWFQTRVEGTGLCVFSLPVPRTEVRVFQLSDSQVQVDGNFALLRKGDIDFTVEKSSKGIVSTLAGGEGILQTFRGTGEVWVAPTQAVYERIARQELAAISGEQRGSNTRT